MTKNCRNCWFYCHTNGKCYVDPRSAYDEDYALRINNQTACEAWAFDGLEDWEREPEEALMIMEPEAAA